MRSTVSAISFKIDSNKEKYKNIKEQSIELEKFTFSGTVCGDKVFQYVKSLSEVRLDRKLYSVSRCIRHKSTHTRKLFNLLIRTSRSRIRHHKYVIIVIKSSKTLGAGCAGDARRDCPCHAASSDVADDRHV